MPQPRDVDTLESNLIRPFSDSWRQQSEKHEPPIERDDDRGEFDELDIMSVHMPCFVFKQKQTDDMELGPSAGARSRSPDKRRRREAANLYHTAIEFSSTQLQKCRDACEIKVRLTIQTFSDTDLEAMTNAKPENLPDVLQFCHRRSVQNGTTFNETPNVSVQSHLAPVCGTASAKTNLAPLVQNRLSILYWLRVAASFDRGASFFA